MHHRAPAPSRRTLLTVTAAAVAAAVTGVSTPAHAGPERPDDRRLRRIIGRMSLAEKVGQLFVTRVYGHSATAPDQADVDANLQEIGVRTAAEAVERYHVGGVIYFTWAHNTRDPEQIAELSNGIQRAALAQGTPVPVLVSTDQEHGIVCRVGKPATLLPGAMALGAGGSQAAARGAARIAGAELAAMGIRQNYAPVADVNVNPANPVIGVRSFGSDPAAVSGMVAAQVEGYQRAGVAATSKHFPGHGDTAVDSHYGLPVITHSREQWEALDAPPFRAAIAAGIDSIMTAHLVVPALDPSEDPATLSRPILTGVLRERLGYDGVVVTDSLGMEGVRTKYGDERVPVLALKAGVDQLLNPPKLEVAWNAVLKAVRDGELTEARLDESILRILRLKAKLGLFRDPYASLAGVRRVVGSPGHLARADRIAEATTTLLRNEGGFLPLSPARHGSVLVVGADPASPSGTTGPPTTTLATALRELGFTATALSTGTAPTAARIEEAVAAAAGKDVVLVGTYNVTASSGQRTLVARLVATGVPVVTIAIRNPYDVAQLTGQRATLAAYSWTDVELRAAVRVLAGRARPRGRLPVPVQSAEDPGRVLFPVGYGLSYR
ncbi:MULTISPECIES: glycoside hydrolase family 3 protein [unclassified Streptomyces]|uniref:glycoside hydrolase family 3 protein n=1 Tax=unclassified Streptomyces TaxID=2593676 RepID=UPI0016605889|nr:MULTISPECIES: glycoside hydrolase family 3 protein [unclassified Streptomyces]MBD0709773.1 beta-N-acetylhexosaminidase [Streptomyces sp. CBMA291]MBD0717710.1 beta-N-acetylhexosaminidase [Streptomyces sp. CBMA370]